jgi:hypothetical protein
MQHILYLTHAVPPRKSESEGIDTSTIDAQPSQNAANPKLTSSLVSQQEACLLFLQPARSYEEEGIHLTWRN